MLAKHLKLCYIIRVEETTPFFIQTVIMKQVTIHCKPSYLDVIKAMKLYYTHNIKTDEIDVVVPDVEYIDGFNHPDGIWEDPDDQLLNHYDIDSEYVNCIELVS